MASRSHLASVAVISIGEMGLGVAKLLKSHNFRVVTSLEGRSENTRTRAESASIDIVKTDGELAEQVDYFLSIVPPKDALATAQRIANAMSSDAFGKREQPLYYLDLNAVSPQHVREIASVLGPLDEQVRFIDGGIVGPPPKPDGSTDAKAPWSVPSIPLSGPYRLADAKPAGAELAELLSSTHIGDDVGSASGLKMCFASMTKGFQAIAVQSFTTAHRLGVLPQLRGLLDKHSQACAKMVGAVPGMPPKAYRWVREMEEIGDTFTLVGGFSHDEGIFDAVARLYSTVAKDTDLGKETTEQRTRGKTVEDVAACVVEGLDRRNGSR